MVLSLYKDRAGCSPCGAEPVSKYLPATLPSPLLPNNPESDALSHPFLLVPKPRPVPRSAPVPLIPRGHLQDLQQWSWALDREREQPYSPLNRPSMFQAPELRNSWEFKEAT